MIYWILVKIQEMMKMKGSNNFNSTKKMMDMKMIKMKMMMMRFKLNSGYEMILDVKHHYAINIFIVSL